MHRETLSWSVSFYIYLGSAGRHDGYRCRPGRLAPAHHLVLCENSHEVCYPALQAIYLILPAVYFELREKEDEMDAYG